MNDQLPESLQPTAADRAAMARLDAERQSIIREVEASSGSRVKVNTESYNSITYGPDGRVVARTINGVPQQDRVQLAVNRAQSAANGEIMRIEADIQRLIEQRDEITGYKPDGSPNYVRGESYRKQLDKQIRQLRLGRVNQIKLNEARWRKAAAETVRQVEEDRITAAELTKELEARGKVRRVMNF